MACGLSVSGSMLGDMIMKVLTISLNLDNDMARVVIETENFKRDAGIDFDDGYPDCADSVLKEVLGEMAKINWQDYLEQLVENTCILQSGQQQD